MPKKFILKSTLICTVVLSGCGQANDHSSKDPSSQATSKVERMCARNKMEQGVYFSISAPGEGRTGRIVNYGGAACMSSYGAATVVVKRDKESKEICQISIQPGQAKTLIALTDDECTWEEMVSTP